MHDQGIGLLQSLRLLGQRWYLLLAVPLLLAGAAYFGSQRWLHPVYRATTTLWVQRQESLPITYDTLMLSRNLAQTYAVVAQSRTILSEAIRSLGLSTTPDELRKRLLVSPVPDTELISLSVTDTDPRRAADLVDAVAHAFMARLQGPTQAAQVSVIDPGEVPERPIRPNLVLNSLAAYALGLALTVAFLLMKELADTSFRTGDDVGVRLGLPVLGTLPAARELRRRKGATSLICTDPAGYSAAAEAYRMLRTNLQFLGLDSPLRTVLVTSALPGEGKSITAANLAALFAQAGKRVCLVDADLRRPAQSSLFGLPPQPGLAEALAESAPIADCLRSTHADGLSLLPSGAPVTNPVELLKPDALRTLLDDLKDRYDLVILDSPPVAAVADAMAMAPLTDGTLMLIRAHSTSHDRVRAACNAIQGVKGRMLGVVLNRVQPLQRGAPYTYRYASRHARVG